MPVVDRAPRSAGSHLLVADLRAVGRRAGLAAVGITDAEPFAATRGHLEQRKEAGLHAGMSFTYRNPARSTDPRALLPSARSIIAGAFAYGGPTLAPRPPGSPRGRVARYARGDHYAALAEGLEAVAEALRAEGWRAVVVVDQNHMVDRAVAERAGLGWYGKSTLLLLPGAGSWFVLGSVLTDAALPPDTPLRPDEDTASGERVGCGPCTRCITDCPTGAIVAPGVVDARRCLAWLVQAPGEIPREHRVGLGDRIYGCDECQDVCPPNRVELRRRERAGEAPEPKGAWVDLLDLLAADDETLLARHGRWYIAGRDPRWLRRNALVALGNVARPDDGNVVAVLERFVAGDDDMLAAHAAWAFRRLGHETALRQLAEVPAAGPMLAAELAQPPPELR